MNKLTIDRAVLYLTALIVLALLGLTIRNQYRSGKEIAFVDIGRLTDGYKYKKELEAASGKTLYQVKATIDSLKLIQKMQPRTGGGYSKIDTQVVRAEYAFNQYYSQSNQEITKKIWDRLNPTIEEYGKDHKIELLIGANGAGTVLYGSTQKDITNDLISYVNTKYEKGN